MNALGHKASGACSHSSVGPVGAEWPSSRKKKESAWPQQHTLSRHRLKAGGGNAWMSPEPLPLGFHCRLSTPEPRHR